MITNNNPSTIAKTFHFAFIGTYVRIKNGEAKTIVFDKAKSSLTIFWKDDSVTFATEPMIAVHLYNRINELLIPVQLA